MRASAISLMFSVLSVISGQFSFAQEFTLKPTVQLPGSTGEVRSIAFSPDRTTIAVGSGDYSLRLYDVSTGKQLKVITDLKDMVTSLAFSADGKTLASAAYDTVRLFVTTHPLRIRRPCSSTSRSSNPRIREAHYIEPAATLL